MKRFALLVMLLAVCVSVSAYAGPSVVLAEDWDGLVKEYPNPFASYATDVSGITTITPAGWSGVGLEYILNRRARTYWGTPRLRNLSGAFEGVPVSLTFQVDSSKSFQVGTVIVSQNVGPSPFSNDTPYTLAFGNSNGSGVVWDSFSVAGPGKLGTIQYRVETISQVAMFDTLCLTGTSASYAGSGGYFDLGEIIILPDRLELLKATGSLDGYAGWGGPQDLVDLVGSAGWMAVNNPSAKELRLTFDFDGLQAVDAIVFCSYQNHSAQFTLSYLDGDGKEVEVAFIDMSGEANVGGWTLPLQFLKSIETTTIYLDFVWPDDGKGRIPALQKVMFFTAAPPIPEPATMTLLALGGVALLRRRK